MDSTSLIEWGGFLIIAVLVFAETGLLVGLVVPGGETLIFTAGHLVSTGSLKVSVVVLLFSMILAGICGDTSGYFIGQRFGNKLYQKKDTRYFKKKYLTLVKDFFKKHSKAALIFGKFLPIIRPFSQVISGTTGIKFSAFLSLSVVTGLLYMSTFILTGYFLGNQFPIIKDCLGWIIPVSILIALIPVIAQIRKHT